MALASCWLFVMLCSDLCVRQVVAVDGVGVRRDHVPMVIWFEPNMTRFDLGNEKPELTWPRFFRMSR